MKRAAKRAPLVGAKKRRDLVNLYAFHHERYFSRPRPPRVRKWLERLQADMASVAERLDELLASRAAAWSSRAGLLRQEEPGEMELAAEARLHLAVDEARHEVIPQPLCGWLRLLKRRIPAIPMHGAPAKSASKIVAAALHVVLEARGGRYRIRDAADELIAIASAAGDLKLTQHSARRLFPKKRARRLSANRK